MSSMCKDQESAGGRDFGGKNHREKEQREARGVHAEEW